MLRSQSAPLASRPRLAWLLFAAASTRPINLTEDKLARHQDHEATASKVNKEKTDADRDVAPIGRAPRHKRRRDLDPHVGCEREDHADCSSDDSQSVSHRQRRQGHGGCVGNREAQDSGTNKGAWRTKPANEKLGNQAEAAYKRSGQDYRNAVERSIDMFCMNEGLARPPHKSSCVGKHQDRRKA